MNVQCGSSAATVFVFSDLLTFWDIFGFDHSSYLEKKLYLEQKMFSVHKHVTVKSWRRVFFSFGFVLSCLLFF